MAQRSWIWVGLFGGITAVLLVWMLLSGGTSGTDAAVARGTDADAPALAFDPRKERVPDKTAITATPLVVDPAALRTPRVDGQGGFANLRSQRVLRTVQLPTTVAKDKTLPALDSAQIRTIVTAQLDLVRGCYDTARLHTPDLPPSMLLAFAVAATDGATTITEVTSDAGDAVLDDCLTSVFSDLRFAPGDDAVIRYPVDLSAGE